MGDLPWRVRVGDVHDAEAVGEPCHGDLGSGHSLAGLMAAGELRLGAAVDPRDLEARERGGAPLVGDVHDPEERR